MLRQLIDSLRRENWPFHVQWERMHSNPFVVMIFFLFALFFAFARFAPNTTDQVNSTHFIFSTSTQTLTLNRTETKISWYKTGVHFNRQKEKKLYKNSKQEYHHPLGMCAETVRKTIKYENQLEIHGLSFPGRLPRSTITLPNKGSVCHV